MKIKDYHYYDVSTDTYQRLKEKLNKYGTLDSEKIVLSGTYCSVGSLTITLTFKTGAEVQYNLEDFPNKKWLRVI